MEAWRQRPLGGRRNVVSRNEKRIDLTPTGLLMEGRYTQVTSGKAMMSAIEIFHQLTKIPTLFARL
jgi:hypothetical protein